MIMQLDIPEEYGPMMDRLIHKKCTRPKPVARPDKGPKGAKPENIAAWKAQKTAWEEYQRQVKEWATRPFSSRRSLVQSIVLKGLAAEFEKAK